MSLIFNFKIKVFTLVKWKLRSMSLKVFHPYTYKCIKMNKKLILTFLWKCTLTINYVLNSKILNLLNLQNSSIKIQVQFSILVSLNLHELKIISSKISDKWEIMQYSFDSVFQVLIFRKSYTWGLYLLVILCSILLL